MGFQIFIENRALKKIEKLDSKTKNRILKALPIQTNIIIGLALESSI